MRFVGVRALLVVTTLSLPTWCVNTDMEVGALGHASTETEDKARDNLDPPRLGRRDLGSVDIGPTVPLSDHESANPVRRSIFTGEVEPIVQLSNAELANPVRRSTFKLHGNAAIAAEPRKYWWQKKLSSLGFIPGLIVDVGANRGDWTRRAKETFPDAEYVLIDGKDHQNEWSNLVADGALTKVEILGARVGKGVDWYEKGSSTGNSYYKERTPAFEKIKPVKKQTSTLDRVLQDLGKAGRKNVLLKVDVQGAELDVLRGATESLKGVEVLQLELPFAGEYNAGTPQFREYVDLLDDLGFVPYDKLEDHVSEGNFVQIDFLYVKKGSVLLQKVQKAIDRGRHRPVA